MFYFRKHNAETNHSKKSYVKKKYKYEYSLAIPYDQQRDRELKPHIIPDTHINQTIPCPWDEQTESHSPDETTETAETSAVSESPAETSTTSEFPAEAPDMTETSDVTEPVTKKVKSKPQIKMEPEDEFLDEYSHPHPKGAD